MVVSGMLHGVCYTRDRDVVHRRVADEVILLPIRHNFGDLESIFTLNEVAARVWELLDGRCTIGEVVAAIVEEFAVTGADAERDIAEFLAQLENIGAVHRGNT